MGCGNCHHWVWSTHKGPSAFVDFTAAHTPKHVTHGSMRWLRLICTPYTNYTPYMHYIIVTWRAVLLASSHCFFHLVGPKSQVETISWNSQLCVAATPIAWRFLKTPTDDGPVEQLAGKSRRLHRPKSRNRENQFSKAVGKSAQRENMGFNFLAIFWASYARKVIKLVLKH